MGRSLKKRKLSNVKRMKVQRFAEPVKKKKKIMKPWEWWLLGVAFVLAVAFIIYLGKSGAITPPPPTVTPAVTTSPAIP